MEGILQIPYVNTDFDDNSFEYKGEYDYLSQLNRAGNSIVGFDGLNDFMENKSNKSASFNMVNQNNTETLMDQLLYYDLPISLFDTDNNGITIDSLLTYYNTEESFMLVFSFDQDTANEDCLVELKSWLSESKKVNDLPDDKYNEDIKMELLPKRTFKLILEKSKSILEDCMFFDFYDDKIAIFVKKIIFIIN